MEERSKTNKEIFEQKYPFKELEQNPIKCAEAIGYLKALIQYFPSEEKMGQRYNSRVVINNVNSRLRYLYAARI